MCNFCAYLGLRQHACYVAVFFLLVCSDNVSAGGAGRGRGLFRRQGRSSFYFFSCICRGYRALRLFAWQAWGPPALSCREAHLASGLVRYPCFSWRLMVGGLQCCVVAPRCLSRSFDISLGCSAVFGGFFQFLPYSPCVLGSVDSSVLAHVFSLPGSGSTQTRDVSFFPVSRSVRADWSVCFCRLFA